MHTVAPHRGSVEAPWDFVLLSMSPVCLSLMPQNGQSGLECTARMRAAGLMLECERRGGGGTSLDQSAVGPASKQIP